MFLVLMFICRTYRSNQKCYHYNVFLNCDLKYLDEIYIVFKRRYVAYNELLLAAFVFV